MEIVIVFPLYTPKLIILEENDAVLVGAFSFTVTPSQKDVLVGVNVTSSAHAPLLPISITARKRISR